MSSWTWVGLAWVLSVPLSAWADMNLAEVVLVDLGWVGLGFECSTVCLGWYEFGRSDWAQRNQSQSIQGLRADGTPYSPQNAIAGHYTHTQPLLISRQSCLPRRRKGHVRLLLLVHHVREERHLRRLRRLDRPARAAALSVSVFLGRVLVLQLVLLRLGERGEPGQVARRLRALPGEGAAAGASHAHGHRGRTQVRERDGLRPD